MPATTGALTWPRAVRAELAELTRTSRSSPSGPPGVLNVPVAGIDLLPGPDGRIYVLEVNAVPGWRAIGRHGAGRGSAVRRFRERSGCTTPEHLPCTRRPVNAANSPAFWRCGARPEMCIQAVVRRPHTSRIRGHAGAIVPALDAGLPLGQTILQAVAATRKVVSTNTNLGIVLLLAPLALATRAESLRLGLDSVLAATTVDDSAAVFQAIRLANPGGLGEAAKENVHANRRSPYGTS